MSEEGKEYTTIQCSNREKERKKGRERERERECKIDLHRRKFA
jgi:hypothetical protein